MRRCAPTSNALRRALPVPFTAIIAASVATPLLSNEASTTSAALHTYATTGSSTCLTRRAACPVEFPRLLGSSVLFLQRRHLVSGALASEATTKADSPPSTSEVPESNGTTAPCRFCLLCDTPFPSWRQHCLEPGHIARTAICRYFVMPERSENLMQHLERHIALDLKELDALAAKKVERRRRRLLAGLLHLVEEGVLKDSLPGVAAPSGEEGSNINSSSSSASRQGTLTDDGPRVNADRFLTRFLLGEGYMRREVIDRAARLVPTLTATELNAVAAYLMSTRQLARIFDELSFQEVVHAYAEKTMAAASQSTNKATEKSSDGEKSKAAKTCGSSDDASATQKETESIAAAEEIAEEGDTGEAATGISQRTDQSNTSSAVSAKTPSPATPGASSAASSWRLSRDDKASILLACVGELEHFHRQDRPRSVLSKLAADILVLNVIATHARDNLISELIHEVLQRIVEEGSPIWRRHQKEVLQHSVVNAGGEAVERNPAEQGGGAGVCQGHHDQINLQDQDVDLLSLVYVRNKPLAATRSPAGVTSSPALDRAAAERLISSYVVFHDVDGGRKEEASESSPAHPNVDVREDAIHMSAGHFATKDWKPLEAGLKRRGDVYRRLQFSRPYPRMHNTQEDSQQ
jgi:hypothetical protein